MWPIAYRHPATREVTEFANAHVERIEFYQYLQWQVDRQISEASRHTSDRKLRIGLCEDLAVGVDPAGAEAWSNQEMFALGIGTGAPPDPFNASGQDWGLPPLVPHRLYETGYGLFSELLRRNMRHAGALRIDHILGLMRQFWVPAGRPPSEGAYIRFPFMDLLGVLTLESQRNHCMVIGEDLGTVPDGLREALMAREILSTRLLYFEWNDDGTPRRPADYPDAAAVAISTHDLPPLRGYWEGRDIAIRDELSLYPNDESRQSDRDARAKDRSALLRALSEEGLLPDSIDPDSSDVPEMDAELASAFHAFLSRTPSVICLAQLTDLLGEIEPVNFPGVGEEFPNWRRKLPLSLEEIRVDEMVRALASRISSERPRLDPPTDTPP